MTSGKGGVDLVKGIDFYHCKEGAAGAVEGEHFDDGTGTEEWLRDLYFTMLNQVRANDGGMERRWKE